MAPMCLLVVLRGVDPDFPVLVASNRDELRNRAASPPGLWVGARRRVLSPRDRRAGGTWIGVNDRGVLAGLTNVAGQPQRTDAPSRGELPHLALDSDDLDAGVAAVTARVQAEHHNAFRLLLCDGERTVVVEWVDGAIALAEAEAVAVISNEHRLGELALAELEPLAAAELTVEARLDGLAALMRDPTERGGHRILKQGGDYGTVSSSLLAVPRLRPRTLIWRYAPGPPDAVDYRNYGNLGRRLVEA